MAQLGYCNKMNKKPLNSESVIIFDNNLQLGSTHSRNVNLIENHLSI
jgi:hypothetical protein